MKSAIVFSEDFIKLPDGEWNYDLISPFFSIRRNGNKLEIMRAGYHEDSEYYNEEEST